MPAHISIEDLDIFADCVTELNDPLYEPSSHATASMYRNGCRGPMCSYARSRARSDRNGGANFLSNDLIEYIIVLLWARSKEGKSPKIYDAPRSTMIFYSRLRARGITEGVDKLLDERYPFIGLPNFERESDPVLSD